MADLSKKAFWIASGDVIARGVSFAASIYLANVLGSEYFGLVTMGIAIVGYATWFADLGMVNIGTREAARDKGRRNFRLKEVLVSKTVLGIAVWIISSVIVWLIPMEDHNKKVILFYLLSVIPFSLMLEWLFNGKQFFGTVAVSKVINAAVYFTLIYLLIDRPNDVIMVPLFYVVALSVAMIFLWTNTKRIKAFSESIRGLSVFRDLMRSSVILGVGWFFAQVVQLLPPILIASFLDLRQAGLYGAAFKFVIIGMLLDRVFVNLLLPNLSSKWAINKQHAQEELQKVFHFIVFGGLMISLILFTEASWFTDLLYSEEYASSAEILRWLSLFIACTFVNSLFSFTLIASDHDLNYFRASVRSGLLSMVILVAAAWSGRAEWVAAGVVLSEVVITLFTYFEFRKVAEVPVLSTLLKGFIPALLIPFALNMLPFSVPFGITAAGLFLILSFSGGLLSPELLKWAFQKI